MQRVARIVGLLTVWSLLFLLTPGAGATLEDPLAGSVEAPNAASRTTVAYAERPPWTVTPCPEISDSITRLYTAYFGRQPEQGGFEFWLDAYSVGGWNLDRMSQQFAVADEFVDTYGALTNAEFVELIYRNVQGREADPVGREFWTAQLDSGQMTRGRVMIFFSESEEYVTRTETALPMAGYLGWYPAGTTWGCSSGQGSLPLSAGDSFADVLIINLEATEQRFTITSYDRSRQAPILLTDRTIPSASTLYYRAEVFRSGDGYLEFDMADRVYWAVVDYPTAMVDARPGWD